jgi:hypothetical protein
MENISSITWFIASGIMWLFEVGDENISAITWLIKMLSDFPEITRLIKRAKEKSFSTHAVN